MCGAGGWRLAADAAVGAAAGRHRPAVQLVERGLEGVHSQHVPAAAGERGRCAGAFSWRSADGVEQRQVRRAQHDHRDGELQRPVERVLDAVLQCVAVPDGARRGARQGPPAGRHSGHARSGTSSACRRSAPVTGRCARFSRARATATRSTPSWRPIRCTPPPPATARRSTRRWPTTRRSPRSPRTAKRRFSSAIRRCRRLPTRAPRRRGDELLQHLGISATPYNANGLGTLNFYRRAQSGNFKLWGASGADGDSHLEHLRYIGEFFKELPLAKEIPEPSTLLLAVGRRRMSAVVEPPPLRSVYPRDR